MGQTYSDERIHIRVDPGLKEALKRCAKVTGRSQTAFVADALRRHVEATMAAEEDATLAPLINEILTTTMRTHSASQRKLTVRLAYEILRLQYVLCEFLVTAGITPGQVETWRADGWAWAVKLFKQQPAVDDEAGQ